MAEQAERGGRRRRNRGGRLADFLDLPRDAVLDLPRLTAVGNLELSVENHRGIVEYSAQRVLIAVNGGAVEVTGKDLALKFILPEQIMLAGQVESVRFLP